jgi:DNA-directed RNA polymerase subunit beta'
MNELMRFFGQVEGVQSFDQIKISIASPERIMSWSFGEIKKAGNHQLPDVQA